MSGVHGEWEVPGERNAWFCRFRDDARAWLVLPVPVWLGAASVVLRRSY